MELEEFQSKRDDILSKVPTEFHDLIQHASWVMGRAHGRATIISHSKALVSLLIPALMQYDKNKGT